VARTRLLSAALAALIVSSLVLSSCVCLDLLEEILEEAESYSTPSTPSPRPSTTSTPAVPVTDGSVLAAPDPDTRLKVKEAPTPTVPPGTRQTVTGTVNTGATVNMGSAQVTPHGGAFTLNAPGQPLNGLELAVPANSFTAARDFKISYAPVTSMTFRDVKALSPLITVDNGGGYSEQAMTLKVPVTVAPGQFAMGFFYDDKKGTLEGLPVTAVDAASITLATRHFSKILILGIEKTLLAGVQDSGFRPRLDDFQFPNCGSYVADGGHCTGQSLVAMWYYFSKPDGAPYTLWGRYDNNGQKPATPGLWEDDSNPYRLCSIIWEEYSIDGLLYDAEYRLARTTDDYTWMLFAFAIKMTGEPQLIEIARKGVRGGHAMVCYQAKDGVLWIADPNFPGDNTRKIEYSGSAFKPYSSAQNAAEALAGKGRSYDLIVYVAKSALLDWSKYADRWAEMKAGTIGTGKFPAYTIYYRNDEAKMVPLKDNVVVNKDRLYVVVRYSNQTVFPAIWRDGAWLPKNNDVITLKPGANRLGIICLYLKNNEWEYVDFKYFTVNSQAISIEPDLVEGQPKTDYTFTAKAPGAPTGAKYEWSTGGRVVQSGASASVKLQWAADGTYIVTLRLLDSAGKELGKTEATAVIATTSGQLASLKQSVKIDCDLSLMSTIHHDYGYKTTDEKENRSYGPSQQIPGTGSLTWNGATFSGKTVSTDTGTTMEVTGTLSNDGKTLLSLVFTWKTNITLRDETEVFLQTWRIQNLPVQDTYGRYYCRAEGTAGKPYLADLKYERTITRAGQVSQRDTLTSYTWDSNSLIVVAFYKAGDLQR